MHDELNIEVRSQLEELTLDPRRPLIVTDADEVIVQFISGLERFLLRTGYRLDLKSFAISGNVRKLANDEVVPREQVQGILSDFFASDTEHLDPVDGAAEALSQLAGRAQIIVLSNVPQGQRAARRRWLERHDMDYPLVANAGPKGAPVKFLNDRIDAPVFFLDDLPPNLNSVSQHADDVHLLHFIADKRLAALMGPAPDCHLHTTEWSDARIFIERQLQDEGF